MLYLVLAVLFLHIQVMPLVLRVTARMDTDGSAGKVTVKLFFLPVYSRSTRFETLRAVLNGEEVRTEANDDKSGGLKGAVKAYFKAVALETVKRVRVRELSLSSRIGAGDAAATAFAVGTARIAYLQACAYFGIPSDGEILPDYDVSGLFMRFSGIFSLCFADIIVALCRAAAKGVRPAKRSIYGNGIN